MAVHPVGFLEDWVFGDFQSLKPNPDEHRIQPIEASHLGDIAVKTSAGDFGFWVSADRLGKGSLVTTSVQLGYGAAGPTAVITSLPDNSSSPNPLGKTGIAFVFQDAATGLSNADNALGFVSLSSTGLVQAIPTAFYAPATNIPNGSTVFMTEVNGDGRLDFVSTLSGQIKIHK